jgi:hypothetical protein
MGGGRFSVLTSNDMPSPTLGASSPARMLAASERRSLREFAVSRLHAGNVVVRALSSGRFVVTSRPDCSAPELKRDEG